MEQQEKIFQGLSISPGISIGIVHYCRKEKPSIKPSYLLSEKQIEWEVGRFKAAIKQSKNEIEKLRSVYSANTDEEEGVLTGHLMMLEDPMILETVESNIRFQKKDSAQVFQQVVMGYQNRFSESKDEYFQQRVDDIVDISTRIINHLCNNENKKISNAPKGSMVITDSLLPSDVIEANPENILGFVTKTGGKNSHTAIIAKAKGIPHVSGVDPLVLQREKAVCIIVDAIDGKVIIHPTKKTIDKYQKLQENQERLYQKIEKQRFQVPETLDGYKVSLMGSLDTLDDVEILCDSAIKGIGLYRSEHLYYKYQGIPSEEKQIEVYSMLSEKMERRSVIIRAFDLEVSQLIKFSTQEFAPMSCRAIRALLKEKDVFRSQARSLLRSNLLGNIKLLLPMVVDISEVLEAKKIIAEEERKLEEEGISFSSLEVGAMLEVPASIIMCETLAQEVDFFSIGSNDLMQYTLAADRNSANLSEFYSVIHPSILRLLRFIISSANRYEKKVFLCGELAADTRLISLFLGLGIQYFTVSTRKIPFVIKAIRELHIVKAYEKTEKALDFLNADELIHFLDNN